MSKFSDKNSLAAQPGLIISYFGSSVAVEAQDGQVFQCHLRRNQELPVVGDKVMWQLEQGETGTIQSIVERQSLLARGDGKGKMRPIAANVDYILIVMSPPPIFSEYLVDRYTIASELLSIKPLIILNKIDLLAEHAESVEERLKPYREIPYPVILTSALTHQGLKEITDILKDKTAVLVGPSGVGKSSIISALAVEAIRVNEVSAKGAGKHTTTATRLYHLPSGGNLIDSPGVREFNLWPVAKEEVLRGFREFKQYLSGCKFRNCGHTVEPGCAVQAAVRSGKISQERFTNYLALLKETSPKLYK